jgi:hypothetical protein
MPLLWFVYPLNGSGRRNPDAADRGEDSFLRNETYLREPASRLIVPLARPNSVCPGTGAMSAFGTERQFAAVQHDAGNGR